MLSRHLTSGFAPQRLQECKYQPDDGTQNLRQSMIQLDLRDLFVSERERWPTARQSTSREPSRRRLTSIFELQLLLLMLHIIRNSSGFSTRLIKAFDRAENSLILMLKVIRRLSGMGKYQRQRTKYNAVKDANYSMLGCGCFSCIVLITATYILAVRWRSSTKADNACASNIKYM